MLEMPLHIWPNKVLKVRKHLDDYFNRRNIRPNVVVETDRFESADWICSSWLRLRYHSEILLPINHSTRPNLEYKKNSSDLCRKFISNYHKKVNTRTSTYIRTTMPKIIYMDF